MSIYRLAVALRPDSGPGPGPDPVRTPRAVSTRDRSPGCGPLPAIRGARRGSRARPGISPGSWRTRVPSGLRAVAVSGSRVGSIGGLGGCELPSIRLRAHGRLRFVAWTARCPRRPEAPSEGERNGSSLETVPSGPHQHLGACLQGVSRAGATRTRVIPAPCWGTERVPCACPGEGAGSWSPASSGLHLTPPSPWRIWLLALSPGYAAAVTATPNWVLGVFLKRPRAWVVPGPRHGGGGPAPGGVLLSRPGGLPVPRAGQEGRVRGHGPFPGDSASPPLSELSPFLMR